jgi:hypothetical protein
MPFQREFEVANPSSYVRDDYVEVDVARLEIPASLDERSLKLSRVTAHQRREEIPFQIDSELGVGSPKRVLTFLSKATPVGADDYNSSRERATFVIEEGTPRGFTSARTRDLLWVAHYYERPEPGEPADGFNRAWYPGRKVYGVQLFNNALEVYYSLVPSMTR